MDRFTDGRIQLGSGRAIIRCRYGTNSCVPTVRIAEDDTADGLLGRDPLALLIGILLDLRMRQ